MLTVVICTDQPVLEIGLRKVLESAADLTVAECCRTFPDVQRIAASRQPNLLIYGLRPDANSLAALRAAAPNTAIVLWGAEFPTDLAHHAVELGVRSFLSSTSEPDTVRDCLRVSAGGEMWMERSLSISMLHSRPPRLSKRQTELVRMLTQGLRNKEIAARLGISEGTVKSYLTVLFEKVGAKDRFELALFGLKNLSSLTEPVPKHSPAHQPAIGTTKRTVA